MVVGRDVPTTFLLACGRNFGHIFGTFSINVLSQPSLFHRVDCRRSIRRCGRLNELRKNTFASNRCFHINFTLLQGKRTYRAALTSLRRALSCFAKENVDFVAQLGNHSLLFVTNIIQIFIYRRLDRRKVQIDEKWHFAASNY